MRPMLFLTPLLLAAAPPDAFHAGTAIPEHGRIADVDVTRPLPPGTTFKIAFDSSAAAEPGKPNRQLDAAARLINMAVANGVAERDVHVAVVLHGKAIEDVLSPAAYAKRHPGATNPNAALVAALIAHGVRIEVCGQSAAALGVARSELADGVELALSAMTAHALLQQQGYTLNPF